MARNVTEQELDLLLARPDAARQEVAARDFHEPRWLSPEDIDALERSARKAAASVLEGLGSALPSEIELEGVEVAEDSLDAGLRAAHPESVALVCEGAAGPVGPSLATLELSAALWLSELALGAGDPSPIAARELSPLEAAIVERLLAQAFTCVAQAFGVNAKDAHLVSDKAEIARVLGTDCDRRRVAVRIAIASGENKLVIHILLGGVTPPPRKPGSGAREKQAAKAALPAQIASTRVEISAVLAELDIMLSDLLALEAGDLIPLSVAPGEPITLRIEGEPCGRARFGERDGHMAVRLTEILQPASTR
jgi:flagellar motor switch protein FliM